MYLAFLTITDFLEKHMLSCPSKKFLNIECPGCGFQRSFIALLKGNFTESFILYPALTPLLLLFAYTLLHLKYGFINGARNIKIIQVFSGIIIFSFYIYKTLIPK